MKMIKLSTIAFVLASFAAVGTASAQKIAIKNNLAYDAINTPNLSLEFGLGSKYTLDVQGGTNFFWYKRDAQDPKYTTKKWSHWLVQPEFRYWTCETFNGLFFGAHLLGGQMNVGGISLPFILQNKNQMMKEHRYEGYFYGGGLSVGYQYALASRWNIEGSIGLGYARVHYDKFKCVNCGNKLGSGTADYLGPTKATISIVYLLK